MIHLAIIENHSYTRDSLINCFEEHPRVCLIHAGSCVREGYRQLSQLEYKPTVLLLDTGFLDHDNQVEVARFKSCRSDMDIVLFDMFSKEEQLFRAFCNGATACISKRASLTQIKTSIEDVHAGQSFMTPGIARRIQSLLNSNTARGKLCLTPPQQEIIAYVKDGMNYNKLTKKLNLPINQIQSEIKKIYYSLHAQQSSKIIN